MKEEKKPSEVLQDFLDYMKFCNKEYQACVSEVWKHDKRTQDFLHGFEFSKNKQERNKLATVVTNSRRDRRRLKDRSKLMENCSKFYSDKKNKQFFDHLKSLINEQRKTEEYLEGERVYKPRVGDDK